MVSETQDFAFAGADRTAQAPGLGGFPRPQGRPGAETSGLVKVRSRPAAVRLTARLPEPTREHREPVASRPVDLLVFYAAFWVVGLLVLYVVVRKAVHHGILDADESRRDRESTQRLQRAVRESSRPEDPTP